MPHGPEQRQFGVGPITHLQPDGSTGPDAFPGTSDENRYGDENIDTPSEVLAAANANPTIQHLPKPYHNLGGSNMTSMNSGDFIEFRDLGAQSVPGYFTPNPATNIIGHYDGWLAPEDGLYIINFSCLTGDSEFLVLFPIHGGLKPTRVSRNGAGFRGVITVDAVDRFNEGDHIGVRGIGVPNMSGSALFLGVGKIG